ncbi:senescence-specific cysteine protease SAG39-like [Salvia divinorum]|uniref:Senescence-specific cysteine protease SAG39-like n=1 Tax=Salvia divinorum TaxID=28513 RepID=A0ABD1FN87_SALDI
MSSNKSCYCTIVLFIFATSWYHVASSLSYSEESMSIKHEKWMAQHGFSYENEKVKEARFQIFKDNVQHIDRHNQEGNHTYKLGLNKFADLTNEEFLAKYARSSMQSSKVVSSYQSSFEYTNIKDIPSSLDWRDHNAVTAVANQGTCGTCWAFSAVATIEGIVAIRSGNLKKLSEQHILDCNYMHEGCKGGRQNSAFEFVIKNGGLASDTDYPYIGIQTACANNKPSSLSLNITGFGFIPPNNETALLAAVANQPVSVDVDITILQFYRSGILTGECGTNLNHAVTVVGYGESEDGVKFWLVKNSWGRGWGDDGYTKLQRNVNAIEGMCGIAMIGCYPIA